jgi:hypothetical protein
MKRQTKTILLLGGLLVVAAAMLIVGSAERRRVAERLRVATSERQALSDSLALSRASVARLRMTVGELEEFRRRDAAEIEALGLRLRRVESLTRVESTTSLDTLLRPVEMATLPILSDSLFSLHWSDGWVALDVTSRPTLSRVEVTSHDTLFQVVHRVPHRWWLFSWGTKAIRQEIRSSNPHTRLTYAEYIEIEK